MSDVVQKPTLRPLSAVRVLAVIFGGPVALLAAIVASATDAARSLRAGRLPRPRSWLMLGVAAAYGAALPWMRGWGATEQERGKALAGDQTVPWPSVQQTRAVSIDAPAERVWPWLAQIGPLGLRQRASRRLRCGPTGLQVLGIDPGRSLTASTPTLSRCCSTPRTSSWSARC